MLVTTHELDEAERMADRLVIIDRGRVVAEGTAEQLRRRSEVDELTFRASPALDVVGLSAAVDGHVVEVAPGRYRVDGGADSRRIAALTAWLAERDEAVSELRTGTSLDEVFLRLTRGPDA